ncbi:MAG: fibronectin type III domain-containing protein, partial [Treponema sp.]|nr:fibronectin type III domain-containing protein [Treponema sp.]
VLSCIPTDKMPSPPARARASLSLQSQTNTIGANSHTASFNDDYFEFIWNPPYSGSTISGEQKSIDADPVYQAEMAKVKGYRIYRSTDPQSGYVKLADVDASTTTYRDIGLTPGKVYYYRIYSLGENSIVSYYSSNILTRY